MHPKCVCAVWLVLALLTAGCSAPAPAPLPPLPSTALPTVSPTEVLLVTIRVSQLVTNKGRLELTPSLVANGQYTGELSIVSAGKVYRSRFDDIRVVGILDSRAGVQVAVLAAEAGAEWLNHLPGQMVEQTTEIDPRWNTPPTLTGDDIYGTVVPRTALPGVQG